MQRQDRGGHSPYAARHRGKCKVCLQSIFLADIPAEFSVCAHMDAHIHHDLSRPEALRPLSLIHI